MVVMSRVGVPMLVVRKRFLQHRHSLLGFFNSYKVSMVDFELLPNVKEDQKRNVAFLDLLGADEELLELKLRQVSVLVRIPHLEQESNLLIEVALGHPCQTRGELLVINQTRAVQVEDLKGVVNQFSVMNANQCHSLGKLFSVKRDVLKPALLGEHAVKKLQGTHVKRSDIFLQASLQPVEVASNAWPVKALVGLDVDHGTLDEIEMSPGSGNGQCRGARP